MVRRWAVRGVEIHVSIKEESGLNLANSQRASILIIADWGLFFLAENDISCISCLDERKKAIDK